eukprot:1758268-Prymnesium_polylepis.1
MDSIAVAVVGLHHVSVRRANVRAVQQPNSARLGVADEQIAWAHVEPDADKASAGHKFLPAAFNRAPLEHNSHRA